MDLHTVHGTDNHNGMPKESFRLKYPRKNGLVLQILHAIPTQHSEVRVRFVHVAFNEVGEKLAAADHRGNIFIIDLSACQFWLLVNLGQCSALEFSPVNEVEIIIAVSNGTLNIVNTEVGKSVGVLKGHSTPVKKISFAKSRFCLSASSEEAIIWDLQSNGQLHRLNLQNDVLLKQVFFMPVTNNILACFQDDAVHIWSFESFHCIKQIVPEAWKNHHIRTFAFTRNGRAMVIGGHSPSFVVFDLDNWEVKQVVGMPDDLTGVRHMEFVPSLFDGGANKILGILSEKCGMQFFNTENFAFLPVPDTLISGLRTFTCSHSGKYIAIILHSGEIDIYKTSKLIDIDCFGENVDGSLKENCQIQKIKHVSSDGHPKVIRTQRNAGRRLQEVHKEIKETLDLERLRPILKEFGEYPESFRILIWKTILQLPYNKQAYVGIVNRDCNPAFVRFEEKYPLENKSILKNLKRLLSCLTHWCSLFGEVKFLPLFVFPFVKVLQNDPFACFEVVVTIILNWCQHWFEYFPFPPVNVLAMIENVLAENDSELMEYFHKKGITSRVYAWPLLEVAFSEVLSVSEWLQFWDHVLSNEPAFLLMAVVSYNITCRSALRFCQNIEDFEHFFRSPNAIDMKRFISKTYSLCQKTSNDNHPRQFLHKFIPLPKDSYPPFNQYPKFIVDYQAAQLEEIRQEEQQLLQEQEKVQEQRLDQERRMKEDKQKELHEARLLRLEREYKRTIEKEEERLAAQRQKIAMLRRDLRARELELLDEARSKLSSQLTMKRSVVMERLLDDIAHKRDQDCNYMAAAEDDLKSHLTDVLIRKQKLQMQLEESFNEPHSSLHHQLLEQQQTQLRHDIAKLREEIKKGQHSKLIELNTQLSALDNKLQQAEVELAKEMVQSEVNLNPSEKNSRITKLERTTNHLEGELQMLLRRLGSLRLYESQQKPLEDSGHSELNKELSDNRRQFHSFHVQSKICERNPELRDCSCKCTAVKSYSEPDLKCRHQKDSGVTKDKPCVYEPSVTFLGNRKSLSYYDCQQKAINSAMKIREQVLLSMQHKS